MLAGEVEMAVVVVDVRVEVAVVGEPADSVEALLSAGYFRSCYRTCHCLLPVCRNCYRMASVINRMVLGE